MVEATRSQYGTGHKRHIVLANSDAMSSLLKTRKAVLQKQIQHKAYSLCFIAKGALCASQQLGSVRRRMEKGGQRRRMHRWELTQGLALLH